MHLHCKNKSVRKLFRICLFGYDTTNFAVTNKSNAPHFTTKCSSFELLRKKHRHKSFLSRSHEKQVAQLPDNKAHRWHAHFISDICIAIYLSGDPCPKFLIATLNLLFANSFCKILIPLMARFLLSWNTNII